MSTTDHRQPRGGEQHRLAATIAHLVSRGSARDVRVFSDDRLVCASYDRGRTLVLNSASSEGWGLIETLKHVWNAAMRAKKGGAKKSHR